MHRFFSKPETLLRLRRGPLGDYLDQYAVWLSEQGFCRVHTRLAIVSGYFALRGYAGDLWKGIAISGAFSISYLVSVWAAFAVELYSPFLNNQERGNVSGQALFVGGLTGAFCALSAISLLLNSGLRRRVTEVVSWTPVGGFLGVAGWALGPSLGMAFWWLVHSMNLTAPTETFRNAQGEPSHMYSLWAVWQAGMGFVFGLIVTGKTSDNGTAEACASFLKLIWEPYRFRLFGT